VVPTTVYAVYKDGRMKPIWTGLTPPDALGKAVRTSPIAAPSGSTGSIGHALGTGFFVLAGTWDSSVTVIAGADYVSTGSVTENDAITLQGENNGKQCGVVVTFKPGTAHKGTGLPNGPSTVTYKGQPNFGLGFSVEGWVSEGEGIGTIGVNATTGKKIPNPWNSKGLWSLEQWTHSWIGENGKPIVAKQTFPDLPLDEAGITATGDSFGFYDHPGGPPPSAGLRRFENHVIKVYKGRTVCEVKFHFIQTGNKIHWGPGLL